MNAWRANVRGELTDAICTNDQRKNSFGRYPGPEPFIYFAGGGGLAGQAFIVDCSDPLAGQVYQFASGRWCSESFARVATAARALRSAAWVEAWLKFARFWRLTLNHHYYREFSGVGNHHPIMQRFPSLEAPWARFKPTPQGSRGEYIASGNDKAFSGIFDSKGHLEPDLRHLTKGRLLTISSRGI